MLAVPTYGERNVKTWPAGRNENSPIFISFVKPISILIVFKIYIDS